MALLRKMTCNLRQPMDLRHPVLWLINLFVPQLLLLLYQMCCNLLKCVAVRALQCVGACCSVLQRAVVCCSVLQCVWHTATHIRSVMPQTLRNQCTVCYSVLRCDTATHCNTLQHTATHCNTRQHTATHCNTLHVCWDAPQCVEVCCSVLQCVAVYTQVLRNNPPPPITTPRPISLPPPFLLGQTFRLHEHTP